MIRRSLSIALSLAAWLVASLAVITALLAWRLASGPISLEYLTPYIEQALSSDETPLRFSIEDTQMRLRAQQGLKLVAVGVRGVGPGNEVLIALPEIEVELSLEALVLHWRLAPVRLAAQAPRLLLSREADGSIGLQGLAPGKLPRPGIAIATLAAPLLTAPDPDRPLSYLEAVEIGGAEVTLEDRIAGISFQASRGQVTLVREAEGVEARVRLELQQPEHVVELDARAHLPGTGGPVRYDVAFAGLRPADLAPFLPDFPLDGGHLALAGRAVGALTLEGRLAPVRFDIQSDGGVIDLPEHLARPLQAEALVARGQLAADLRSVRVEQLSLRANGGLVHAAGYVSVRRGVRIEAAIGVENITAQELPALWPPEVARAARAWVVENVTGGTVEKAQAHIQLRPEDLEQAPPLRKDAVQGTFTYRDVTLRYFNHLPPLLGVAGSAAFDAQTINFAVQSGHTGKLKVRSGTASITGIGIKGRHDTQLAVVANVEGPLGEALTLLDRPPFGFAGKLGIEPARGRGATRTELRVGLPLYQGVTADEVRVAAKATLRGVALENLRGVVDLSEGEFSLAVDNASAVLDGKARVSGIPLDIEWREDFKTGSQFDRRYRLKGRLSQDDLVSLGLQAAVPPGFTGSFNADLTATEKAGERQLEAALDLEQAALELPWLDWKKPVGKPATLTLDATIPAEGDARIDAFQLRASDLVASGSAVLAPASLALRSLALSEFRTARQAGSARIKPVPGNGYAVAITAQSLNLGPFLASNDAAEQEEPVPLELDVTAREVLVREHALRDLRAVLERDRLGWREGEARAGLPDGGFVAATLAPEREWRRLNVESDRAGKVLRVLEQTERIEGGALELRARIYAQEPRLDADGKLVIDDFILHDAPVLARLLTLASLTGIGNLLAGEGISFNRLSVPYSIHDGIVTIEDGRLAGSQLGLTFQGKIDLDLERLDLHGTIVPVYGLNRAIGRIPVLGDFLTGSEGVGAFAATYSVRGPFADPNVRVNPLSVLAPGFIRDLFRGIRRGTLEPPPPPKE